MTYSWKASTACHVRALGRMHNIAMGLQSNHYGCCQSACDASSRLDTKPLHSHLWCGFKPLQACFRLTCKPLNTSKVPVECAERGF